MTAKLRVGNRVYSVRAAIEDGSLVISDGDRIRLSVSDIDIALVRIWLAAIIDEGGVIRSSPPQRTVKTISFDDVPKGDPLTAWKLIYLRFRDTLPEVATAAAYEYKRIAGEKIKHPKAIASPEASSQLDEDVTTVWPHRHKLIESGEPVRGVQSKIAKLLGVQNAGNYRQRILDVLEVLTANSTNSNRLENVTDKALERNIA